MNTNFRNTQDRREIIKIFGTFDSKQNLLWQNLHGKRFVYNIEAISVDPSLNKVQFRVLEDIHMLHNQSVIYVKLSNLESFCKLKYLNHANRVISCQIPTDLQTLELRSNPRMVLNPEKPIFATVLIGSDLLSSAKKALKLQINNLSTTGIALTVSEKDYLNLTDSLFVEISHLNDLKLEHNIIIEQVHCRESRYLQGHKYKNGHKIGYRFIKNLDQLFVDQVVLSIPG